MSGYLTQLGVRCDAEGCPVNLTADFLVGDSDDRDTRLGYVLNHASDMGWGVAGREYPSSAETFCPAHARSAAKRGAI